MPVGTVHTVIVCLPRPPARTQSVAPCTSVNGVHFQPDLVNAYLVDPANASLFDAAIPPLDAASVAQVWSAAFAVVVLFFLLGRGVGSVLSLIRKG